MTKVVVIAKRPALLRQSEPAFENRCVMASVARNNVRQGSDRHCAIIRKAFTPPGCCRQVPKKGQTGTPDRFEFIDQIGEWQQVEAGFANVGIFIESRQGRLVSAGEAQCPVPEYPFGVGNMADHFFDGPSIRCMQNAAFGLRYSRKRPRTSPSWLARTANTSSSGTKLTYLAKYGKYSSGSGRCMDSSPRCKVDLTNDSVDGTSCVNQRRRSILPIGRPKLWTSAASPNSSALAISFPFIFLGQGG